MDVIWRKVWGWWGLSSLRVASLAQFKSGNFLPSDSLFPAKAFEAVCVGNLWSIWQWRNKIAHADGLLEEEKFRQEDIFPGLQRTVATWLAARSKKLKLDVKVWISSPKGALMDPG